MELNPTSVLVLLVCVISGLLFSTASPHSIGCFSQSDDVFTHVQTPDDPELVPQRCVDYCRYRGYGYASLRLTECRCAVTYSAVEHATGILGVSASENYDCTGACEADNSQVCGAANHELVFYAGMNLPDYDCVGDVMYPKNSRLARGMALCSANGVFRMDVVDTNRMRIYNVLTMEEHYSRNNAYLMAMHSNGDVCWYPGEQQGSAGCTRPDTAATALVLTDHGRLERRHANGDLSWNTASGNCRLTYLGSEYQGTVSTTDQGHTCQHWNSQTPNAHDVTAALMGDATLADAVNYCRAADNRPVLWCYTIDGVGHENCGITVPYCLDGYPVYMSDRRGVFTKRDELRDKVNSTCVDVDLSALPVSIKTDVAPGTTSYTVELTGDVQCTNDGLIAAAQRADEHRDCSGDGGSITTWDSCTKEATSSGCRFTCQCQPSGGSTHCGKFKVTFLSTYTHQAAVCAVQLQY